MRKKKKIEIDPLDKEVVDYIRKLRFKRKLIGVDPLDMWKVISNVQKYYERKLDQQTAIYQAELEKLRGRNGS